jgi:S-adenosylmethionine-dependent methyltransferase
MLSRNRRSSRRTSFRHPHAFDADHQVNGLGLATRGDTVEDLTDRLRRHGLDLLAWYGVRLFSEGWGRTEPPTADDGDLFAAELEASRRDPYRQLSRLFHLLATPTTES